MATKPCFSWRLWTRGRGCSRWAPVRAAPSPRSVGPGAARALPRCRDRCVPCSGPFSSSTPQRRNGAVQVQTRRAPEGWSSRKKFVSFELMAGDGEGVISSASQPVGFVCGGMRCGSTRGGACVTDRDRAVVAWVAVIGAVSAGDVMARFGVGRTVGYRRLARLVDHGLLTRSRLVYGQPTLYTATREGLAWAGLSQLEPARVGVATTRHWAVCARLAVELQRVERCEVWGEPRLRAAELEAGESVASARLGDLPDGRPRLRRPARRSTTRSRTAPTLRSPTRSSPAPHRSLRGGGTAAATGCSGIDRRSLAGSGARRDQRRRRAHLRDPRPEPPRLRIAAHSRRAAHGRWLRVGRKPRRASHAPGRHVRAGRPPARAHVLDRVAPDAANRDGPADRAVHPVPTASPAACMLTGSATLPRRKGPQWLRLPHMAELDVLFVRRVISSRSPS